MLCSVTVRKPVMSSGCTYITWWPSRSSVQNDCGAEFGRGFRWWHAVLLWKIRP